MITNQQLSGQWNQLKGTVRQRWGKLTDDDLQSAKGNAEQLIGLIQERTGEARQEVEAFLEKTIADGASVLHRAGEKATQYAQNVGETAREYGNQISTKAREGYDAASEAVQTGYDQAQDGIRAYPMSSVVSAFGIGVVTGAILGLMMHRR